MTGSRIANVAVEDKPNAMGPTDALNTSLGLAKAIGA